MLDTRQRRALVLAVVTVLSGIVGTVVIAGPAVMDTPSGGTVAPSEVYEGSRVNHSYLFTDDDFNANGRNTFEIDLVGLPSDADLESATATVDGGEENVESVEANVTDANTITLDANLSGTGDVTYNVSYTADYTAVDATDDTTYDIETTNTDDGTGPGATATVHLLDDTRPRTQLVGNAPQIVWFDEELDITDLNLQADGEPTGVSYNAGESGTLTGVTGNAEDEGDTVAFSDASDVAFDNVAEGGFDADKDDSSETDDSASNDVDVLVDEPEIRRITLRDETGENVSEGSVERGNARLELTARYDFQPASPLDVRVLDPAGFNVTDAVVERDRATLRSSEEDRLVVDLSDRNQTGDYTVTVRTPSTSEIAATASTTVTLTDSTDDGDGGTANETAVPNFTVTWEGGDSDEFGEEPNPQDPGEENVSLRMYAPYYPVDHTPMGNLTLVTPAGQGNTCKLTGAQAFGIDRNNDGRPDDDSDDGSMSNTYTDVTLVDKFEVNRNYTRPGDGKNVTWLDFWDEGEAAGGFGDNSVDLYREDEVVLSQDGCYTQPEQPGWYRWYGYLNGSADGDPEDTTGGDWRGAFWHGDESDEVAAVYSHWYYVCDCANRTEAEQTLGTPPDYDPDRNGSIVAPNYRPNQRLALAYYDTDGDGDGELVYGGERVRLGNRNETEPAAPENLTAIEKPSRVRLEWEQPTAGGEVGYYDVYRGPECGESMTRIDRVGPTQRSVVDRRVEPGQAYCYGVEAVNDVGTSPRPTVTAVPAPLPDPAVTNVSVTKTRLRTDYTEPIVNPLGPQEIDVTVSNLGDHATENDGHTHYGAYGTEYPASYGLTVYACPKEASNDAVDDVKDRAFLVERCETVDHFDGEELAANDSTTFTAEWDSAGHAGDYEIRAWLDYDRPEADRENDEGRSETFVIVGGTGAGGAGVEEPDSEPNPPGPEPDPPVYGPENEDPSGPTDAPDASDGVTTPTVGVAPASFCPAASWLFPSAFAGALLSFARR